MSPKRIIVKVHTYLGLLSAAFLLILSVTGVLIVFQGELIEAAYPEVGIPTEERETVGMEQVLAAVEPALEAGEQVGFVLYPNSRFRINAFAALSNRGGETVAHFVHPYDGVVLSSEAIQRSWAFIPIFLHEDLMSGDIGEILVAFGGLAMFLSAITALYIWWPRDRAARKLMRVEMAGPMPRKIYRFHSVAGIWLAIVAAIVGLSGFAIVEPELVGLPGAVPLAEMSESTGESQADCGAPTTFAQAEALALATVPGGSLSDIGEWPPVSPYFEFGMRKDGDPNRYSGSQSVIIDARCPRVLRYVDGSLGGAGNWLRAGIQSIHSGRIVGVAGEAVVFVSGVAVTILAVTGFLIWWRRLRRTGRW